MSYQITWITTYLGVGRAPMSYEDLNSIRSQGIDGIVNLCYEFSDLHELEEQAGFEVFYLPVADDYAPDLDKLEQVLQWLDEAIYLKKKILVHCRFGRGRTGTITSAYLLRRGLGMKRTEKELKITGAIPTTYRQWKVLRKYEKKQRKLSFQSPKIDHNQRDNLSSFFTRYQKIADKVDAKMVSRGIKHLCGQKNDCCCHTSIQLPLLEALYLSDSLNRRLTASERTSAITRAVACQKKLKQSLGCISNNQQHYSLQEIYIKEPLLCPLSINGTCILFATRPIRCRCNSGIELDSSFMQAVMNELVQLSDEAFLALSGQTRPSPGVYSSLIDTVSGKFIQTYFHLLSMPGR